MCTDYFETDRAKSVKPQATLACLSDVLIRNRLAGDLQIIIPKNP